MSELEISENILARIIENCDETTGIKATFDHLDELHGINRNIHNLLQNKKRSFPFNHYDTNTNKTIRWSHVGNGYGYDPNDRKHVYAKVPRDFGMDKEISPRLSKSNSSVNRGKSILSNGTSILKPVTTIDTTIDTNIGSSSSSTYWKEFWNRHERDGLFPPMTQNVQILNMLSLLPNKCPEEMEENERMRKSNYEKDTIMTNEVLKEPTSELNGLLYTKLITSINISSNNSRITLDSQPPYLMNKKQFDESYTLWNGYTQGHSKNTLQYLRHHQQILKGPKHSNLKLMKEKIEFSANKSLIDLNGSGCNNKKGYNDVDDDDYFTYGNGDTPFSLFIHHKTIELSKQYQDINERLAHLRNKCAREIQKNVRVKSSSAVTTASESESEPIVTVTSLAEKEKRNQMIIAKYRRNQRNNNNNYR